MPSGPSRAGECAGVSECFRVRLEKEAFVFSAAHFITYHGDVCEPLHGHNYGVACEIAGPLDENQYVVDFIALRDRLAEITRELDHRVILPANHPLICVAPDEREVLVTFQDRRWIFPRPDCVILPVANTTAELLARYIGGRLLVVLDSQYGFRPSEMVVSVDECRGQWGVFEWKAEGAG